MPGGAPPDPAALVPAQAERRARIVHGALRLLEDGEYEYDHVSLSLEESRPSFVPSGSVVLHVCGPASANWDEVLELLDAMTAAGDGVVFSEDRQVVLDHRTG